MYVILRILCAVGALAAYGCGSHGPGTSENAAVSGPLTVRYTVSTSPGTSSGGTIEGVTRVEFHDGVVAVFLENGSGRIYPASRIHHFSWDRPQKR